MKKVLLLGGLICLLLAPRAAVALEVPLEYVKFGDRTGGRVFQPFGYSQLTVSLARPAGEWRLPAFQSPQPLFALVTLADGQRLVAFDQVAGKEDGATGQLLRDFGVSAKADEFYNRMYFDANGNRDLTDDAPVNGRPVFPESRDARSCHVQFPSVDTTVQRDGQAVPFRFRVYLEGTGLQDGSPGRLTDLYPHVQARLMLGCCYAGTFRLGTHAYSFQLADMNCNGSCGDAGRISDIRYGGEVPRRFYTRGDELFIRRDGRPDEEDGEILGDYLLLEETLYEVRVSEAARRLTLTPVAVPLLPVQLGGATHRSALWMPDRQRMVTLVGAGDRVLLPAGQYQLVHYQLRQKDSAGAVWQLEARGSAENAGATARNGATPQLKFGEPYTASVAVSARQRTRLDADLNLAFSLRGAGDEAVTSFRREAGRSASIAMSTRSPYLPKEPSYRILQADGEIVAQGDFEYG